MRGRLEVQEPDEPEEELLGVPDPPPVVERAPGTVPMATPAARSAAVQLDPKFVFDTFVAASSNRLAHAAAQAVAETPGRSYNPLFIYGDSGLGKTHLLHAIGNYVSENFPRRHVLYVTTETFMNDFVDSLRTSTTLAFKRRYRECDVLLIDDVQFMENKEGLQEEFFHTYNDLKGASKQIVLTSDRPAQVDRDPRGPAAQPLPLGPDHRDRPARPRDPPGHLALQVRERAPRGPRRRPRLHRHPREEQHPGARRGPDQGQCLRQAQQGGHLAGPGRARPLRHRPGRRAPPDHPPDDPRRHRRPATASPSRPSAGPAGPGPWSPPARSPCTWSGT